MAKRKQETPPPGSPAWMATFSDLMNLLLCFFVLLFSMSNVDEKKFDQVVASMSSAFSILDGGYLQNHRPQDRHLLQPYWAEFQCSLKGQLFRLKFL